MKMAQFGTNDGELSIRFVKTTNPNDENGVAIEIRNWDNLCGIFLIDSQIEKLQEFLREGDGA